MAESNLAGTIPTVLPAGGGGQVGSTTAGSQSDDPPDNERLARMLERIRSTLNKLVHLHPKIMPEPIATNLANTWPEVQSSLSQIIGVLRGQVSINLPPNTNLAKLLETAGLTGEMLRMKEASLLYFLLNIEVSLSGYEKKHSATDRPVLTYPEKKGLLERFFGFLKPGFTVINSILGSLPDVFGAKEMIKEFKDHTEAGYAVGEYLSTQRESG
jgi:hypothetical protein